MHRSIERPGSSAIASVVLWTARVLTVAILGFWSFMIIAHLVGTEGASSRPLVVGDYVLLSTTVASLVGLGLALRWEWLGAATTLVAIAVAVVVNWKVLMFPMTLIPITAALFLLHALLAAKKRRQAITGAP